MQLGTDKIIAEKADGIGRLVFNNPERRNAVSLDMYQAVSTVIRDFEADPAVRVIVVSGAGGKAFVSGSDISQFEDQRKNAEQSAAFSKYSAEAMELLAAATKPVISMIQGFCIGGGIRVALSSDLRIATEGSQFAIPAAKLGLGYSFESVEKLVGLVGPVAAKDLLFTGRRMGAQEALRIGLINKVVSDEALEPTVRELALEIANNAPLTVRSCKLLVNQAMLDPARRDMAAVEASIRACFDSQDYALGRRAFMEKRTPEFTGA